MKPGAVFLSYSSHDSAAARRLADALRAAGVEVWVDQSELRGGDAWDRSIRAQIKDCTLFVPLISANTQARAEGYFRLEWRLGVERSHLMADDHPFLLPVVIDDTAETTARVPDSFRERQWSRLPGGEPTPEFIAQLKRLLSGEVIAAAPRRAAPVKKEERGKHKGLMRGLISLTAIVGATLISIFGNPDRGAKHVAKPAPPVAAEAAASRKSIAVLPFENLSGAPDDAYLADGLHEEILNALARLRDLTVISRTSVMEFRGKEKNVREIGRRLGVGTVLEGSIRRDGKTLRLTIQLIDAATDRPILATNYDRELGHVLDLQSAVARQVAEALSATLTKYDQGLLDRVGTSSGDAYDRYLRAVATFRQPDRFDDNGLVTPKKLLAEAIGFDPDYGDALALLGQVNAWSYFFNASAADAAAAKQAIDRAIAIDPQSPEAQLARGIYSMYVVKDVDQAMKDLAGVVELRPNHAEAHQILGLALRRRGQFDAALGHLQRAWTLNPLDQNSIGIVLITYLGLRRWPEAIDVTRRYTEESPNDLDGYLTRARIESFAQGTLDPLRAALKTHASALDPATRKAVEAEVARGEGRYREAIRLLDRVPTSTPLDRRMRVAFLYSAAGDRAQAQKAFRAIETELQASGHLGPAPSDDIWKLALAQSMLDEHARAIETIDRARELDPESKDATNGPYVSFLRSFILVRAGRKDEGYAEVDRLLHVAFSNPTDFFEDADPVLLAMKDDPRYDELSKRPPRL